MNNVKIITLLGTSMLAAICTPTLAQTSAPTAPQSLDTADTIIVTGTRRTDRTVAESSVPIDVVNST